MNLRTKLALALVATSLASMAALGYFAYVSSAQLLSEISHRQLDALAESKKRDLTKVLDGWRENVRLIRSRTRLRQTLRAHASSPSDAQLADLDRIVSDVYGSSRSLRRLVLFGPDGGLVSAAGDSVAAPSTRELPDGTVHFSGIHVEGDGELGIEFQSSLLLDGERVGSLQVIFRADPIRAITNDFTGLGATGETYVVAVSPADHFLMLNSLRHDEGPELRRGALADAPASAAAAVVGQEAVLAGTPIDYRGEPVIAATRSLPGLGWGIVVKIDQAEESQRAQRLAKMLRDLGLSIGALAILGGTLLGFQLARPIRELAHIVDIARRGDIDLRAPERGDDEVAFLARSVNELLDQTRELAERKRGK
jgi:HAMP domain-containing protein